MKKILCMVALVAISFGSVYAAPVQDKTTVPVQVKKKKVTKKATKKHSTRKVVKKDSIKP